MNFYASLIFLGIMLVLFSLAWVVIDKKKTFSFIKNADSKKQELTEIITDAEQMIEELNKFSDYIVTQMDIKNEELQVNLKNAEERISNLGLKSETAAKGLISADIDCADSSGEKTIEQVNNVQGTKVANGTYGAFPGKSAPAVSERPVSKIEKPVLRKTDNVIPFNNKYKEVLKLSQEGLDVVEIARRLGTGKGEIELIMGINRN